MQLLAENEGNPCIYNVTLNENKEYEVVEVLYKKVVDLLTATVNSIGTIDAMLSMLQHLAIFKYFEDLENRLPNMTFHHTLLLGTWHFHYQAFWYLGFHYRDHP